jgi:hypothetical protein
MDNIDCSKPCNCDTGVENLIEISDVKKCIYCGCYFARIDFPQTFERQLTCGCVDCEGSRRKERLRIKKSRRQP